MLYGLRHTKHHYFSNAADLEICQFGMSIPEHSGFGPSSVWRNSLDALTHHYSCSLAHRVLGKWAMNSWVPQSVSVCVGVWAVCLFLNLNYEWVATVLNSLIWYHCTVFGNAKLAGIKYFRLNLASYWNNVFGGVVALGMAHLLNYLATGWRPYRVTSKI